MLASATYLTNGGAPLAMKQLAIPSEERSLTQLVELTRRSIGADKREAPKAATARSAAGKHELPPCCGGAHVVAPRSASTWNVPHASPASASQHRTTK